MGGSGSTTESTTHPAHHTQILEFERRPRSKLKLKPTDTASHCSTPQLKKESHQSSRQSYPEGNFGRNQLPDGSMSLSPLCSGQAVTICTSVPLNASFHQSFRLASPCLSIAHHLSGLIQGALCNIGGCAQTTHHPLNTCVARTRL